MKRAKSRPNLLRSSVFLAMMTPSTSLWLAPPGVTIRSGASPLCPLSQRHNNAVGGVGLAAIFAPALHQRPPARHHVGAAIRLIKCAKRMRQRHLDKFIRVSGLLAGPRLEGGPKAVRVDGTLHSRQLPP